MRLVQIPLCVFLIALPLSFAQAQTLTPHTVMVTGTATIKSAPDNVVITANLTSADKSAAAALQANKDTVAHLIQILRPFNIPASQIQVSATNIQNARGPANLLAGQIQQATGNYTINNRVIITLDDLSKLPAVLDALTQTGGGLVDQRAVWPERQGRAGRQGQDRGDCQCQASGGCAGGSGKSESRQDDRHLLNHGGGQCSGRSEFRGPGRLANRQMARSRSHSRSLWSMGCSKFAGAGFISRHPRF